MAQTEPAVGQAGQVIDALDAPAAAGHAAGMLARLAEREAERVAAAAARAQAVAVSADPRESVDNFLEDFAAQRQQLEAELEAAGSGGGGGGSGADGGALAPLLERIGELEKAVADAAYFLPAYDLRQATLALAALRERQEAAAAALQPRRRFAFNRKAPKAAAAAAAAAAGTARGAAEDAQPSPQQGQPPRQQGAGGGPAAAAAAGVQAQAAAAEQEQRGGRALRGLRGQALVLGRADAAGQEWTLSDLEGCTVHLLAPLAGLFLHGLRRCHVVTGPVAGACFVEGAEDCTLMIAARQVRIHAAQRCDFYLRVRSHPIIEHSSALRFAPYAAGAAYEGGERDLEEQGLAPESGMWAQVHDFGWLRATQSPHWAELPEMERVPVPAPPAGGAGTGGGGPGGAS